VVKKGTTAADRKCHHITCDDAIQGRHVQKTPIPATRSLILPHLTEQGGIWGMALQWWDLSKVEKTWRFWKPLKKSPKPWMKGRTGGCGAFDFQRILSKRKK
jgi:hypothetical protein